jgi:ComF family protein
MENIPFKGFISTRVYALPVYHRAMERLLEYLSGAWASMLDALFPRTALVKKLEGMDVSTFVRETKAAEDFPLSWIHARFSYRDPLVREAIWQMKYRGNPRIARLLAATVGDEIIAMAAETVELQGGKPLLLVPLPLSRERKAERGFNQCEMLAEAVMKIAGEGLLEYRPDVLKKVRHTKTQTSIRKKKDRLENLAGCFAVAKPEAAKGRRVVLLDDVATTGATLSEARKALKAAGAKGVEARVVAH